ncbi:MAG TPA: ABC transporter substrate-binding protein [Stellaceae bacterium]|nr:ABC transporter substrate-binding protein [Stellaceae bacterium]
MRRREFITLLGGAAVWPPTARAQRSPFVVGIIGDAPIWHYFRDGMRDLGYVEGQNVRFELRGNEGEPDRFSEAAKELVGIPVDVIVANGSISAQAAQIATRTIPIVMIAVGDPVRAGLVASLARPSGNITGNSILGPDVAPKRVQFLKEVIPSVVRLALLLNSNNASNVVLRDEVEAATPALGISLIPIEARTVAELDRNLAAMLSEHPDALLVTGDPLHQLNIQKIIRFLADNRIPGMFQIRENVIAGGLMSYGASLPDLFRRGATYVHKILQGTKPSDLPVEQPTKFELVIDLKTANALGLTIPPSTLAIADEVIE